jgi:hypothetical protein
MTVATMHETATVPQLSPIIPKLVIPILLILAAVVPYSADFVVDFVLFYPFCHFSRLSALCL